MFFNGFLLATILYCYVERQYEQNLYTSIADYVRSQSLGISGGQKVSEDSLCINSLHLVHRLGERRQPVFENNPVTGVKAGILQPVSIDLMTAQGACGSHSYVLARLLQELNFEIRIPQMTVQGQDAGHIIVEAKTSHGWVVLDPLSDAYFKNPDGMLAGFNDVKDNWTSFQQQLPPGYNMSYRYEGVRYTNWNKIPVVMPLIKGFLTLAVGKEIANNFSFRTYALRKFHILFEATIFIYSLIFLFICRRYLRRNHEKITRHLPSFFPHKKPVLIISGKPERKVA